MSKTKGDFFSIALQEHLKKRTVVIVPLDDVTDGFSDSGGTGTCIQIGQRRFVATASHVLTVPKERLTLHSTEAPPGWIKPGTIHRTGHRAPPLDVAYLELGDDTVADLHCEFVGLDRLRPFVGYLPPECAVGIFGFPSDRRDPSSGPRFHRGAGMGFTTLAVEAPSRQPVAPMRDFYIDYPSAWQREGETIDGPRAFGYSGTALWAANNQVGAFWAPQHSELIAILRDWAPDEHWARATQIQHWLSLVADDYPDLRDEIRSHLASSSHPVSS